MIEVGGLPGRWSWPGPAPRAWAAVAALAVALAAGFAAGHLTAGSPAPRARPTAGTVASTPATAVRAPATPPAPAFASGAFPQIFFTGNRCSVQHGHALQLGIEIVNRSGRTITVNQIKSELPLGGLRQVSSAMATCGALPVPGGVPLTTIPDGTDAWLSMTFDVLIRCPAALPVLFAIDYATAGRLASVYFDGFPDLGSVPYSGCRR